MSGAVTPPEPAEPDGETGLWIVVKVGLFIALPILIGYVVKFLTS